MCLAPISTDQLGACSYDTMRPLFRQARSTLSQVPDGALGLRLTSALFENMREVDTLRNVDMAQRKMDDQIN